MIDLAEGELTRRSTEGDADALCLLLARYEEQLRRRIAGKITARFRAAFDEYDVLQVTYVEVFLRIGSFKPNGPGSFAGWVTRIAEHNLIDGIRGLERAKRPPRDRRIQPTRADDSRGCLLDTLTGTRNTPSRDAVRREGTDLLEEALGQLPADYERVVRLHDLKEQSMSAVAEAMGRSVGAVRMLRARAHDRLVELLGESTNFFPRRA